MDVLKWIDNNGGASSCLSPLQTLWCLKSGQFALGTCLALELLQSSRVSVPLVRGVIKGEVWGRGWHPDLQDGNVELCSI